MEVFFDVNRLKLTNVNSAAQWGSLTLNNCEVVKVEKKDDYLLVGIEDKLADVSYQVKTKDLLKMDQEERDIFLKVYLIRFSEELMLKRMVNILKMSFSK